MAAAQNCCVCLEGFNGRRQPVTCQYCPCTGCRPCLQSYLTQTFQDPHCMECKRGWSSEFMAANFPLSFRNDTLRKWRRRILVEREKAALPAMQEFVEYKRAAQKAREEAAKLSPAWQAAYEASNQAANLLSDIQARYNVSKERVRGMNEFMKGGEVVDMDAYYAAKLKKKGLAEELETQRAVYNVARTAYIEINTQYMEFQNAEWEARDAYHGRRRGDRAPRREFIMKCPAEDCRGFLSSAYRCGTCEKWTCSDCLEVLGPTKDAAHTCNKDTVETAKAIKSETRPCPKCGTRIFKIDGCDQMYCTMEGCGTAFSWQTGQIELGRVHNPHYYEWLRRTGGGQAPREAGDIPCGGMPAAYQLMAYITDAELSMKVRGDIAESHRNIEELIHSRIHDFQVPTGPLVNKELDVLYLMKQIDEATWRRQLELTEAKYRRKTEILQILQMATAAASDLFRSILSELPRIRKRVEKNLWLTTVFWPELERLRTFVNTSFQELSKRQHMAVPQFDEFWKWVPLRAFYKGERAGGKAKDAEEEDRASRKERGGKQAVATAEGRGPMAAGGASTEEPDEWAFLAEAADAPSST